jgi:hypothetical protein
MNNLQLFGISVLFSFAAWTYVAVAYIWPELRSRPLAAAATPILVLHLFRFVGASFLVTGVASADLSAGFSVPAAYGDLIAVGFAWIALAVRSRPGFKACLLAFNLWGTADLLYAFYQGLFGARLEAGTLGATFYIPTLYVPLLLCTHVIIFLLLARSAQVNSDVGR